MIHAQQKGYNPAEVLRGPVQRGRPQLPHRRRSQPSRRGAGGLPGRAGGQPRGRPALREAFELDESQPDSSPSRTRTCPAIGAAVVASQKPAGRGAVARWASCRLRRLRRREVPHHRPADDGQRRAAARPGRDVRDALRRRPHRRVPGHRHRQRLDERRRHRRRRANGRGDLHPHAGPAHRGRQRGPRADRPRVGRQAQHPRGRARPARAAS